MNKDQLKTIVLVSLFIISLFLTQELLIQWPYRASLSFGQDAEESTNNYILSDMISPERYIIHFGRDDERVIYSKEQAQLWGSAKNIIKEVFQREDVEVVPVEEAIYEQYKTKSTSVNFLFNTKIPTHVFSKILGVRQVGDIHEAITSIDDVYIYLGAEPALVLSHDDQHVEIKLKRSKTDLMKQKIDGFKEGYTKYFNRKSQLGTEEDVYITLDVNEGFRDIVLGNTLDIKNILLKRDYSTIEPLVESFFEKDIDYIRRVEDNEKAIIYMYDEKGLILSKDGILEYVGTIEQPVQERNLYKSLDTAVRFIKSKDSWPNDVYREIYIHGIEEIDYKGNEGYRIIFDYRIEDYPLLLNERVDGKESKTLAPIEIEVYNDYVKNYKRFIGETQAYRGQQYSIKAPLQVIEENINHIQKQYINKDEAEKQDANINEILSTIQDIKLAYYARDTYMDEKLLVPVWVIHMKDRTYIFEAETGKYYESYK